MLLGFLPLYVGLIGCIEAYRSRWLNEVISLFTCAVKEDEQSRDCSFSICATK